MATVADLEFRYSGGAANSDPAASIGSVMSSSALRSQAGTGTANISGVIFADGALNAAGAGTLEFNATNTTLEWTPNGGAPGGPRTLTVDGRYWLPGDGDGFIVVDVIIASLPTADASDVVSIVDVKNTLYDDVPGSESTAGRIEYRCIYLHNVHPADTLVAATTFIGAQPSGPDDLAIGLDPAGVGDGAATGVATTAADEITAPAGVVFTAPNSIGTGLVIGDLLPGQGQALWLRRNVPVGTTTDALRDIAQIHVDVTV